MSDQFRMMDGNEAAAYIAYQLNDAWSASRSCHASLKLSAGSEDMATIAEMAYLWKVTLERYYQAHCYRYCCYRRNTQH